MSIWTRALPAPTPREQMAKPAPADLAVVPAQLEKLQTQFSKDAHAEADRFTDATDSEYWVAVCFRDREAKEKFLEAAGLADLGDKYLDGHEVAKRMKIELGAKKEFKRAKKNKRLEQLT